jgi:hypothetical protein
LQPHECHRCHGHAGVVRESRDLHGQAYLASTDIGRNLVENERVKVVCVRKETAYFGDTAVAARPAPSVR